METIHQAGGYLFIFLQLQYPETVITKVNKRRSVGSLTTVTAQDLNSKLLLFQLAQLITDVELNLHFWLPELCVCSWAGRLDAEQRLIGACSGQRIITPFDKTHSPQNSLSKHSTEEQLVIHLKKYI